MNEQEKSYLEALYKDRVDSAKTLEKPSMRGIKKEVVDKYSDQAHFIYELLQNADDAQATQVHFLLESERLLFSHNGTRHFSVSNPENEELDSQNGTLGDINAITSIANSNKTTSSIGKFGVGFKAVFQHTLTPHIYDSNICFKIDHFIVPSLIPDTFPNRKKNETLFVFPFDNPQHDAKESNLYIISKLRNLVYPLLFLTNLMKIEYKKDDICGSYTKELRDCFKKDDIVIEDICLSKKDNNNTTNERILLFSRTDNSGRKYSVGFFLDEDGSLIPTNKPAFCFFPTKETTALNFVLHAPFLLTDNREGIRAGNKHNEVLIEHLASLCADAVVIMCSMSNNNGEQLVDDSILDIIPFDIDDFSDPEDKSRISFAPFYHSILKSFQNKPIIPSTNGYVSSQNAYWASTVDLPEVFSNDQLSEICKNKSACWAFPTIGRDAKRGNKPLCDYVDAIVKTYIDDETVLKGRGQTRDKYYIPTLQNYKTIVPIEGISESFIESQSIKWLIKFYAWISRSSNRIKTSKYRPLFLNEKRKAVAAYDKNDQPILFLPVDNVKGYNVINADLLNDAKTKDFLIKEIGIAQPSAKDMIYNTIRPLYLYGAPDDVSTLNLDNHFLILFKYYYSCSIQDASDLITMVKDWSFLAYYINNEKTDCSFYGTANTMYVPTDELRNYFETKPGTRFVNWDKYIKLVGKENEGKLSDFLHELGVKDSISILLVPIENSSERKDLPRPGSTRSIIYNENVIDGCKEIVEYISLFNNKNKSILLWNQLLLFIRNNCNYSSLEDYLTGTCEYYFRSSRRKIFESSDKRILLEKKWLTNQDGVFVNAYELTTKTISRDYDISSEAAKKLLSFLKITDLPNTIEEDDSNLSDSQRLKIEFANTFMKNGITEDDLRGFLRYKQQIENRRNTSDNTNNSFATGSHTTKDSFSETGDTIRGDEIDSNAVSFEGKNPTFKMSKTKSNVVSDIVNRTQEKNTHRPVKHIEQIEEVDQDDFTPHSVSYHKKIDRAKQKSAEELDKIVYEEDLQKRAAAAPRYSYEWFNALLEMECYNSSDENSNNKEVSITFAKVEREPGTNRTLVLKHPNHYIPHFVEDLTDIPLVLHMKEDKKSLIIEVANIKSYTLRVKIKKCPALDEINLDMVTAATIDAKSPDFLLEELQKEFLALGFDTDYNLRDNLCKNIEFVFGPPGTGKTTHLAKNVIIPTMKMEKCRVLVLTPTNKSADVLVRRIMEVSQEDKSYEDWLIRFGLTGDEIIEQSPVFKDKSFDLYSLHKSVTITTIARFPYDFFMPSGKRYYLRETDWDYIIIDEASMIPIASIVYPLYKKKPKKFIIAGDPFQIEPITTVDIWKDENIYSLVHLDSFKKPETVPYQYNVELLTTQYRSIPEIGDLFSNFAYDGILNNFRSSNDSKNLYLRNGTKLSHLNIVKFPVSKYESVYRAKRLQHSSSYQIYSAIFAFEYICYLSKEIVRTNTEEVLRLGVIAPYRAQADLIDKLFSSEVLTKNVEVQVGTIHSFQGDECDIVFTMFNPPPKISDSKEIFLNKMNIINVAISRARDYLFVLMPDDDTENVDCLKLVKRVEWLIKKSSTWTEMLSPDIEKEIFGDSNYLENNVFSTSHQSVNVYGLPEKRYEVRSEEYAIDIQIHKEINNARMYNPYKNNMPTVVINDSEEASSDQEPRREVKRDDGFNSQLSYDIKQPQKTNNASLSVIFPDGTLIQCKTIAETMTETINRIGPARVAQLEIYSNKELLVSRYRNPKYPNEDQPLKDGYYVNTHSNSMYKIKQLKEISERLELNLIVDYK